MSCAPHNIVWESQAAITMNSSNQRASFLCSFFFPQRSPQIFLLSSALGITLSLKIYPLSSLNTFFCSTWGIWFCRYWFILVSYRLIFSDFPFSRCSIFSMTTLIPFAFMLFILSTLLLYFLVNVFLVTSFLMNLTNTFKSFLIAVISLSYSCLLQGLLLSSSFQILATPYHFSFSFPYILFMYYI